MFTSNIKLAAVAAALSVSLTTAAWSVEGTMKRTTINPTTWAAGLFNQGEVSEGHSRILHIAGQVSVEEKADAPFGVVAKHPGDMHAQMTEALANIDAVLTAAEMGRGDLTYLRFSVTDMKAGLENSMSSWRGSATTARHRVSSA